MCENLTLSLPTGKKLMARLVYVAPQTKQVATEKEERAVGVPIQKAEHATIVLLESERFK